jgi:PAS domain S-box-containing protein
MTEIDRDRLWKLLWEYNPNGLIVVEADLHIKLVNPAFCQMFRTTQEEIIGQPVSLILEDAEDFQMVWQTGKAIRGQDKIYSQYNLYINRSIFSIEEEGIIACIMVDLSHELERQKELKKLKLETAKKVNEVVDNQMKIVQEIASLLGETTAETKVSLLKIIQMLEKEHI